MVFEYLKAEDEIERNEEAEEEHLQDVLHHIRLVDHAGPLQGHADLHRQNVKHGVSVEAKQHVKDSLFQFRATLPLKEPVSLDPHSSN